MAKEKELKNPFSQQGSLIFQVFSMAMRGTTLKEIKKKVLSQGGNPTRLIRILRLGEWNGRRWTIEEAENGIIRATPYGEVIPRHLRKKKKCQEDLDEKR